MSAQSLCWPAFLAIVMLPGCAKPLPPPAKAAVVPVSVSVASMKSVPVQARVIGKVKAISTVAVRAQFGGQLMQVHFKEGDLVKKGQKLFTIDPRMYQAAVKLAAANLAKSRAVLLGAERILARVERLSGGAVSAEEIDVARTAVDSARAVVAADEAALNSAQVQETYTSISSPLDGRTGELNVTAGNLVAVNDINPLVIINQINPIHVSFTLPEQQLPAVTSAQQERPLKVEAFHRKGEPPMQGELKFIDNAIDPATGTVQLKAEFSNENGKLWPGQFIDIVLTIRERPGSVVIPNAAVQSGQQGQYVFVITPEKSVEMRSITLAFESGNEAVIASGLSGGETVVVEGQLRLAPGTKVEVKDSSAQPSKTANQHVPESVKEPAKKGKE